MPRYLLLATACLSMLLWSSAFAQRESAEAAEAQPVPASRELKLKLTDGSMVTGQLQTTTIKITTSFGDLSVPLANLISFTPGLDSRPQLGQRIHSLIEQLGSPNNLEREEAQRELQKLGQRIRPQLEARQNDRDPERKLRIRVILEDLDEQADAWSDDADDTAAVLQKKDTIITDEFTIVGRINQKTFQFASRYGKLTVQLSDIQSASANIEEVIRDVRMKLAVKGEHQANGPYMKSGVRIERGDSVSIKADGALTLPWAGNMASTPMGVSNYGWYVNGQIPVAALLARVGPNGTPFMVGIEKTFDATESGELQFAIAPHPSYGNQVLPGQYNVKLFVDKKE